MSGYARGEATLERVSCLTSRRSYIKNPEVKLEGLIVEPQSGLNRRLSKTRA